jgi:hypothetical protein
MARMTIAEVTAEVLRKWCGSDAERKPPISTHERPRFNSEPLHSVALKRGLREVGASPLVSWRPPRFLQNGSGVSRSSRQQHRN